MSSEMFASEEVTYFEGSPVEPPHNYQPESHWRYYENVVYVQHFVTPIMLLEYIPVYINYQTYEPFLINRFEVVYVPFLRQTSVTYLVPYYLQTQEFVSSSIENEYDTPSNSYTEISLDHTISDDLDEINSSTSYSDVTSVLSLPDSSNAYENREFSSSTQESCESLQVCTESNKNLDSKCRDEEYSEAYFSEVDADDGIDAHAPNLSLVFVNDEKGPNELDCSIDYLHPVSFHEDRHFESDVLSISLSDDTKKPEGLTGLEKDEASSVKNTEKGRNISPERCENNVVFDNDIEICVSSASSLEYVDKCLNEYGLEHQERSPLKNDKILNELDCTGTILHPILFHEDDVESDISSPSLLTAAEKPGGLTDSAKIEASSLKTIAKDRNHSPERRENDTVFYSNMESGVASSLGYAERCQVENGLEHSQMLSVKNKNVKTSYSHSSPQMPVWSHETSLEKPGSLPKIDDMVPGPFDDANSEKENDSDGDPAISLQDTLASEEYRSLKREEYFDKRRSTQLYRSALERDICPRRSLPEVGTLATIFEDLPYPINEPYDDGLQLDQESANDEFELPPLELEGSKSSHTTLLPKKKRFEKTRKFFSGLLRCFRPP